MSATETAVRVDLAKLVNCTELNSPPPRPFVWSVDVDGERWLSDRFWLLPESACVVPATMKITSLPGDNAKSVRTWVHALRNNPLTPTGARFAATFAGILTLAGLSTFDCGIDKGNAAHQPLALATDPDHPVGIIMPVHPDKAGSRHVSIPVPPEVVTQYERIAWTDIYQAGVIRECDAWELAVQLTAVHP